MRIVWTEETIINLEITQMVDRRTLPEENVQGTNLTYIVSQSCVRKYEPIVKRA